MPDYDKPHIPEHSRAGLAVMNAGKPLAALQGNAELRPRLRLAAHFPTSGRSAPDTANA